MVDVNALPYGNGFMVGLNLASLNGRTRNGRNGVVKLFMFLPVAHRALLMMGLVQSNEILKTMPYLCFLLASNIMLTSMERIILLLGASLS